MAIAEEITPKAERETMNITEYQKDQLLRILAFAHKKQSISDREEQFKKGINPDGYRELYKAVEKIKPKKAREGSVVIETDTGE